MPDLVVHQWGRLGDLIQTGIVLSRWKAQVGGRTILTCDSKYAPLVRTMSCVDHCLAVDLKLAVDLSRQTYSANRSLRIVERMIAESELPSGGIHLTLTRSGSTALYSSLFEPDEELGYRWERGRLQTPEVLKESLQGERGEPYPVHICDVWSRMVGLRSNTFPDLLFPHPAQCHDKLRKQRVLIFADAGDPKRALSQDWITGLCRQLIEQTDCEITIAGQTPVIDKDDLCVLEQKHKDRFNDCRGKTTIEDLVSICRENNTVIGPDTGGLHLAAASGCRVIGLYTGGAGVFNTGPYCEQAYVIQNPDWSDSDCNSVIELVKNSLPSDHHKKSQFWTPYMDDLGICYEHPMWNQESRSKVETLRCQLHNRWQRTESVAVL